MATRCRLKITITNQPSLHARMAILWPTGIQPIVGRKEGVLVLFKRDLKRGQRLGLKPGFSLMRQIETNAAQRSTSIGTLECSIISAPCPPLALFKTSWVYLSIVEIHDRRSYNICVLAVFHRLLPTYLRREMYLVPSLPLLHVTP